MARGHKGAGSVFQRTYRDAHGRKKRTNNWYIEYVVGDGTIREATAYTKRSDAVEFLKKRTSDALKRQDVLQNQAWNAFNAKARAGSGDPHFHQLEPVDELVAEDRRSQKYRVHDPGGKVGPCAESRSVSGGDFRPTLAPCLRALSSRERTQHS